MTTSTTHTVTCDRCGAIASMVKSPGRAFSTALELPADWSYVSVQGEKSTPHYDLCPDCTGRALEPGIRRRPTGPLGWFELDSGGKVDLDQVVMLLRTDGQPEISRIAADVIEKTHRPEEVS